MVSERERESEKGTERKTEEKEVGRKTVEDRGREREKE